MGPPLQPGTLPQCEAAVAVDVARSGGLLSLVRRVCGLGGSPSGSSGEWARGDDGGSTGSGAAVDWVMVVASRGDIGDGRAGGESVQLRTESILFQRF